MKIRGDPLELKITSWAIKNQHLNGTMVYERVSVDAGSEPNRMQQGTLFFECLRKVAS
jgi:hypothetical protein